MAHTKTGASIKGSRNSIAKRLGVKRFGGETVEPGNIILRQRGSKFKPGTGVIQGKDYTLMAITSGKVLFSKKQSRVFVSVA